MAYANRSNDGDEDLLLLILLLSPLPNRSLHCAAAATMLSSSKHNHPSFSLYLVDQASGEKEKSSAPGEGKKVCWGGKAGKVFTY